MVTGQPLGDLLDTDESMLLTLHEVHEGHWTRLEHLVGVLVDAVNAAGFNALVGPHVDPRKLRSVKPPKPLQRPGLPKPRRATVREIIEMAYAKPAEESAPDG